MLLGIPGICSYFLLKKSVGRIGDGTVESVLSIFVLSLFCYVGSDCLLWVLYEVSFHHLWRSGAEFGIMRGLLGATPKINDLAIACSTMVSVPVAAAVSFAYRKKYWNKLCQKIGVSQKYGDEDVFNFLLDSGGPGRSSAWYVVRDHKQNLVYYGAITTWSDHGADRELILSDVDVHSNVGAASLLYSCRSLYICRNRDDLSIELPSASQNTT